MKARIWILSALLTLGASLGGVLAQSDAKINVLDQGSHVLPASKNLTVRHIRSMKVNVVAASGDRLQYNSSITANRMGLERNFGDGKLKYSVQGEAAVLEFRPYPQSPQREQSWIKSLLTKESRYEAVVDKAELTLTVPSDVYLTIDSQHSDISVAGLRRALKLVGRYGRIAVQDHIGDLTISNLYGAVAVDRVEGDVQVASRSSTNRINGVTGKLAVSGPSLNLEVVDVGGFVSIENRSGKNKLRNLRGGLRLDANYSEINLADIAGEARVTARNVAKFDAERVGSLHISSMQSLITLNDVGSTSLYGSSLRLVGKNLRGTLTAEGERNTIDLDGHAGGAAIRNINGTVTTSGSKGDFSVTGTGNTVTLNAHYGENVDIVQAKGNVTIHSMVAPLRYSIVNAGGKVDLNLMSDFSGKFSIRNELGYIYHNLEGGNDFSRRVEVAQEVSGGSGPGEIRIVNKNGDVSVRNPR